MKKLLIIKTGTTFPAIRKEHGDFEDFIIKQIDLHPKEVFVVSVYKSEALPDISQISSIIITGSHSMVTDYKKWSIHLTKWLRDLAHQSIPILGICYGHQLLAEAFGGKVDYHPKGKEIGTVEIELTKQGMQDKLLGILPKAFLGHVTHAQTVTMPPQNSHILAKNEFENHHALSIMNNKIWGVQFHPEFNADITYDYIRHQQTALEEEKYDLDKLYDSVKMHSYGELLLKRFIELQ